MDRDRFLLAVEPPRTVGRRLRWTAQVTSPALGSSDLWYEVDAACAGYVTDAADPFVLATLVLAMRERVDLVVTGASVDGRLLRNLVEFQRVWRAWFDYTPVAIHADVRAPAPAPDERVVAFSGGADSAFSAWWHTRGDGGGNPLRGAMMIHGMDIPLSDPDGFAGAAARARHLTDSLDLELIVVATNAWTLPVPIGHYTGMGVSAALHLLGGRFGDGLVPSTATYQDLVVPLNSSPVTDWMLGGDSFSITHDGAAYHRLDKLRALTEWPEAMASLRVCLDDPRHDRNCGTCHKCMMTLVAFRLLGVEASCFASSPTADEITQWARRLPSAPYFLQEGMFLVDAAVAAGVDERWVRVLRNRIRTARLKDGVRAAWPGLAEGVASVHGRVAAVLPTRR